MTKADAADLLDLIIDRAPRLRAAGVRSVELEHAAFAMLPAEQPDTGRTVEEDDEVDALHDPTTYGRRKAVPGRRREEQKA